MVEIANRPQTQEHATPVSRVPFTRTQICEEACQAVQQVLGSGWVTSGPQVIEFEREFAEHLGARRAVAVSSCTAALELALRALHLPAGSRVLMSTITFCGAASAIVHAGLQLVLADVDPVTAMPSPVTVAAAARAVGGVQAMIVVHLGGLPTPVEEMAQAAGITLDYVIEDAAHALGTTVGDKVVGTISRATCFSFYATKNLAIGEGGMLTTDDDELADAVGRARLHGLSKDSWRRYLPGGSWRYDVEDDGLKANMTDVQAAIGRAQLRRFETTQARRAQVAARYDSLLADIPGLTLPLRPRTGRHAWHLYAVRVRPSFGVSRDDLITELNKRGIGSSVHFIPVHRLTWFSHLCQKAPGGFPGAESVFDQTLSLPMDQVLTDADINTVCTDLADIGQTR